jgi:hypothetical protein
MHRIGIVIKEHHRHAQHAAKVMQPAGADAVRAALVFLHLLEGQTKRLAELLLRQTEHVAAQPNPGADPDVDRVGFVGSLPAGSSRRLHSAPARASGSRDADIAYASMSSMPACNL